MEPNQDCHCPRVKHFHGTQQNYLTHACRCTPCTNDATTKRDHLRRQKAYGRPHTHRIPATQTRKHIKTLTQNGMSITSIARSSGISHAQISRIAGRHKYAPATHIYNTTAAKILAVTTTTRQTFGLIDGTGTRRRIQALAAIGYPLGVQARLAGLQADKPRHTLNQRQVNVVTAKAISDLYARLELTQAPPSRAGTRARNTARRNGWLPPLAWDEDRIDDPAHAGYPEAVAA